VLSTPPPELLGVISLRPFFELVHWSPNEILSLAECQVIAFSPGPLCARCLSEKAFQVVSLLKAVLSLAPYCPLRPRTANPFSRSPRIASAPPHLALLVYVRKHGSTLFPPFSPTSFPELFLPSVATLSNFHAFPFPSTIYPPFFVLN